MSKLAMNGGSKLADRAFPTWPVHDDEDEKNLLNVFRRNKWWMYAFGTDELAPGETADEISQVEQFEQEFAKAQRVAHCRRCPGPVGEARADDNLVLLLLCPSQQLRNIFRSMLAISVECDHRTDIELQSRAKPSDETSAFSLVSCMAQDGYRQSR